MPMSDKQWYEGLLKGLEREKHIRSGEIRLFESEDPLFLAVQMHDTDTINRLLENGADVNVRDENGLTPLMLAFTSYDSFGSDKHREIVDRLLAAGADCGIRDGEGRTVLHHACLSGTGCSVIRSLVGQGSEVNATDDKGQTSLMYAAASGLMAYSIVGDLLNMGADPTLETNEGHSVWDYVLNAGTARAVFAGCDVDHLDSRGETVLMKICRDVIPELAKRALEKGADVSLRNKEGKSALTIACESRPHPDHFPNQVDLVNLLLEHDCDPMDGRTDGEPVTAPVNDGLRLLDAVYDGDYETARALLEKGTSTLVLRPEAGTPLMIAARRGDLRFVEILVAARADVNAESYSLRTNALVSAASGGHTEVVRRLLEAGADVNAHVGDHRCHFSTNALIRASTCGHIEVVRALLEAGADVNSYGVRGSESQYRFTPLSQAACEGHIEVARLLIASGADINECAALAEAAEKGDMGLVRLLVENGANVNVCNGIYESVATSLMYAVRQGRSDLVEYLLEHGANPEDTDDEYSLLSEALDSGNLEIVRMLEKAIADRGSGSE